MLYGVKGLRNIAVIGDLSRRYLSEVAESEKKWCGLARELLRAYKIRKKGSAKLRHYLNVFERLGRIVAGHARCGNSEKAKGRVLVVAISAHNWWGDGLGAKELALRSYFSYPSAAWPTMS